MQSGNILFGLTWENNTVINPFKGQVGFGLDGARTCGKMRCFHGASACTICQ